MSMPEFSPDYCPECGKKLETRDIEGRDRLWCGNCEEVEWLNPGICAGLVVEKGGEFLLQKRGIWPRKGKWSVPAGFLELEETPLEAAKRETFEETGLEVDGEPSFVTHFNMENPDGSRVVVAIYKIGYEQVSGELRPEEDEVEELRFWTLQEILSNSDELEHGKYVDLFEEIGRN